MARRRRDRPRTDDTNWSLRDEVSWYTDQAKAAAGVTRELLSIPRTIGREARAMVREMRSGPEPVAAGDPLLRPAGGVEFETWVAISADAARRGIRPDDTAGRAAVAREHGIEPGVWERAAGEWERRLRTQPRLAQHFATRLRSVNVPDAPV